MTIPVDIARELTVSYTDSYFKNLFAQSDARSILKEVGESPDNFENFTHGLTGKITITAYSILSVGISLAELGQYDEASESLKQSAILLYNEYYHSSAIEDASCFHLLISSMAFYASGQYSRAFVTMRKVNPKTDLEIIIGAYLKKKVGRLIKSSNPYILPDLDTVEDYDDICEHSVTVAVSKALALTLEYFTCGDYKYIADAQEILSSALSISIAYKSPSLWCVVRLLKLMIHDNGKSSLWSVLPPFFPNDCQLLDRYIRALLFSRNSVMELWESQRQAIPVVLDPTKDGAIVSMRTSSGKTRVAELAMLQAFSNNNTAKILYLAPFRSLAFEIEQTLSQIFDALGFRVSHLYGGFRISSVDRQLSEESSIIIATPEKAKAILRGSPELFDEIDLIIVDEGHLIGANERYVKNEIFLDHIRVIANLIHCKIIMLSAVLPNPADFSMWLTQSADNVAKSDWKPSGERFGLLRWMGDHARVDWRGEVESFNPNFASVCKIPKQYSKKDGVWAWRRRMVGFPNTKNEAIACSAKRLTSIGPVLVFCGQARSIENLAAATMTALGDEYLHPWPDNEWQIFSCICEEELADGSIVIESAKKGVICHSNMLPAQVRIAVERLMRSYPPQVIIATTTLGQGVNIGISSVIIASPYLGDRNPLNHSDFWNICGRAGRAYIDGEGKILIAIDEALKSVPNVSENNENQKQRDNAISYNRDIRRKARKIKQLADNYFDPSNSNIVTSGLLYVINGIYSISCTLDIEFSQLLEMIAENDFSAFNEKEALCNSVIDLIDDGLLAFQEDERINPEGLDPELWVDDTFRTSLAAIQTNLERVQVTKDQLFKVIKTRLNAIVTNYPDHNERKAYVSTGLPFSVATCVYRDKDLFIDKINILFETECTPYKIVEFLKWLEGWAQENASTIFNKIYGNEAMDLIRSDWICGVSMRELSGLCEEADKICKDVYGYSIPWLINAIAQLLRVLGSEEKGDMLGDVGVLVELGVPNTSASLIFLAGIRSRSAATELSQMEISLGDTVSKVKRSLRNEDTLNIVRSEATTATLAWVNLLYEISNASQQTFTNIESFSCPQLSESVDEIIVRSHGNDVYLYSVDGKEKFCVECNDRFPFDKIKNDYRISFVRNYDVFEQFHRDPRSEVFYD